MNDSKINIIDTLKEGAALLNISIVQLVKVVLPWLITAVIFECLLENTNNLALRATLIIASSLSGTIATISSIKIFLGKIREQEHIILKTSIMAFIFFIIANEYISLAATIGSLFFILPALLIYASAAFTPLFVLDKNYGPFESLDKSIDATKGNVWRIVGALLIIWIASTATNSIMNFISTSNQWVINSINAFTSLITLFFGLASTAVTAILYEKLRSRGDLIQDEES